jgi:hypothetical protein
MGLLDDAIREHLELKRKHGAPDEELTRQETEALGPARRDFATDEAEPAEPVAPVPSDEAAADYVPEPAPPVERAAASEPPGWLDEEEPEVPAAAEPPPAPPEPPEPAVKAVQAVPPRRESETPTQGFDALSVDDEDEDAAGDEDVLEETPDFLQDTPEHDRLWFEQKPPRDFDFDD